MATQTCYYKAINGEEAALWSRLLDTWRQNCCSRRGGWWDDSMDKSNALLQSTIAILAIISLAGLSGNAVRFLQSAKEGRGA